MVRCKAYFDILNSLGVTYECDKQIDGRTDRHSFSLGMYDICSSMIIVWLTLSIVINKSSQRAISGCDVSVSTPMKW